MHKTSPACTDGRDRATRAFATAVLIATVGCAADGGGGNLADGGPEGGAAPEAGTGDAGSDRGTPPGSWQHGALPGVLQRRIEDVAVDLDAGSAELELEVPAGMASLTVVIDGAQQQQYWVCSLKRATGEVLVRDGWGKGDSAGELLCRDCGVQVRKYYKLGSVVLRAAGAAAALAAGRYALRVCRASYASGPDDDRADVHAFLKALPTSDRGRIDLDLHFAGVGIAAREAAADPAIQGHLARTRAVLGAAGIEIGEVRYFDADARFRSLVFLELDDGGPARWELFAAHPGGPGIDVYFVQRFELFGNVADVLGLSTVPGVPAPGLTGVVLALDDAIPVRGQVDEGLVLAHELGHMLGLFHTGENPDGPLAGVVDELDDTPDEDPGYLMFWNPRGEQLSPSQRALLRASPLVSE